MTTVHADDLAINGTLTFLPGQTSQTIPVTVLGDVLDELDETILVDLTAATNATISDGQGVVTILDDDARSEERSEGKEGREGKCGATNAGRTVRLSIA